MRSSRRFSHAELQEETGVSRATLMRDLTWLRDERNYPIHWDGGAQCHQLRACEHAHSPATAEQATLCLEAIEVFAEFTVSGVAAGGDGCHFTGNGALEGGAGQVVVGPVFADAQRLDFSVASLPVQIDRPVGARHNPLLQLLQSAGLLAAFNLLLDALRLGEGAGGARICRRRFC